MAKDSRLATIDADLKKAGFKKLKSTKDFEVYEMGTINLWCPSEANDDPVVTREYWKDITAGVKAVDTGKLGQINVAELLADVADEKLLATDGDIKPILDASLVTEL